MNDDSIYTTKFEMAYPKSAAKTRELLKSVKCTSDETNRSIRLIYVLAQCYEAWIDEGDGDRSIDPSIREMVESMAQKNGVAFESCAEQLVTFTATAMTDLEIHLSINCVAEVSGFEFVLSGVADENAETLIENVWIIRGHGHMLWSRSGREPHEIHLEQLRSIR